MGSGYTCTGVDLLGVIGATRKILLRRVVLLKDWRDVGIVEALVDLDSPSESESVSLTVGTAA
jgi:hypothetical protein